MGHIWMKRQNDVLQLEGKANTLFGLASVLDFAVLFNKQQHCTRVAYSCVSCCSGTKIARK
jgi:hypothetical protein